MDDDTTPNKLDFEFPSNHAYPCKFYKHFFFKPLLIALILLVTLQLFPSEVPEIISQYLYTRSWEILQLVFVVIAVSYGLFSKKSSSTNDDDDNEIENEYYNYSSKFDNVDQSSVSKLLQASLFDDEAENHEKGQPGALSSRYARGPGKGPTTRVCCTKPYPAFLREAENHDENKIQTWENQYHSDKPVVVVAQESSRTVEKPLLLPVRSLKSPVLEPISPRSLSSPRKLSLHSFSSESEAKIDDKFIIKQSKQSVLKSSVSSPPPPPTPPPRPLIRESTQLKSTSIVTDEKGVSENDLRRSITTLPMELRDENQYKKAYKGKSFRTIRPFVGAARARLLYSKDYVNEKEEAFAEKRVLCTDKMMDEKYHFASKPALMEIPDEETKIQYVENVLLKSDEDTEIESEDDYIEETSGNVEVLSKSVGDIGPDVDKKADEFIAKFREQIKLQRIASGRKSAGLQPG